MTGYKSVVSCPLDYLLVMLLLEHFFQWLYKSMESCQLQKIWISSNWEVFLQVQNDHRVSMFYPWEHRA